MKNYRGTLSIKLDSCEKEPIHHIGRIQPHGYLIILNREGLVIEQVSENISNLTGFAVDELLNQPFNNIQTDIFKGLIPVITTGSMLRDMTFQCGESLICLINTVNDKLFLEFEPVVIANYSTLFHFQKFLSLSIKELREAVNLQALSTIAAEKMQEFLEYDSVFIYRFDEDKHCQVIAEKVRPGYQSFLNHFFPSTDIPEQARAMMLKKVVRQIPDTYAEGVDIMPYINPHTKQPTDMLLAELRNPSEIHLEYMQNMGAKASITFSVIVKGELWGAISCINYAQRFIDVRQRMIAECLAHFYGNQLLAVKDKEDSRLRHRYEQALKKLSLQMEMNQSIPSALLNEPANLLSLSDTKGAALILDNDIYTIGITPGENEINELAKWLSVYSEDEVYYTHKLPAKYSPSLHYKTVASGLMALEISRYNRDYILLFKPEVKNSIEWAGNPHKGIEIKDDEKQLHPRKSFEKWEEETEGTSHPWNFTEINIAHMLRREVVNNRIKSQADILRKQNRKLEDLAFISSHNLRSPLANFKGLLSLYTSYPSEENNQFIIDKLNEVSKQMSDTLNEINEILLSESEKTMHQEKLSQESLEEILSMEIKNHIGEIEASGALITTEFDDMAIYYPKVYMQSIFHNLISNALKYRHPERVPEIKIKTYKVNNNSYIEISDNGIGIDLEKNANKIFGLYKTFHRHPESKGIGLYMLKNQIESMKGTIKVKSTVGEGTTFIIKLQ